MREYMELMQRLERLEQMIYRQNNIIAILHNKIVELENQKKPVDEDSGVSFMKDEMQIETSGDW